MRVNYLGPNLPLSPESFAAGLVESGYGIWATDLDLKGGLAPMFQGSIVYRSRCTSNR
jgi:hypothetical protein